jgi:hypothetical protein
VVVKVP